VKVIAYHGFCDRSPRYDSAAINRVTGSIYSRSLISVKKTDTTKTIHPKVIKIFNPAVSIEKVLPVQRVALGRSKARVANDAA